MKNIQRTRETEASTVLGAEITPVCAIGASTGGVAALRSFFEHIDTEIGLAYMVIMHLSPDQPSALVNSLTACTKCLFSTSSTLLQSPCGA